jgi:UDP-N-acetylmuramate dehydrogenase
MKIERNISLKNYNTCGIDVLTNTFIKINISSDIVELTKQYTTLPQPVYILGLGANTLFTNNFTGTIIHISTKGISVISEDDNSIFIKVKAGEIWDDFVTFCIKNNYYGVENLVAIPSTVGAVPIQNIGAYGVEASDIIHEVYYTNIIDSKNYIINKESCNFSYRDSIFKNELKDKIIITEVVFKLSKRPSFKLNYGQIQDELIKINNPNPKIQDIANIIRNIRYTKLPDYKINGNAGSFFKNPIISIKKYNILLEDFPNIISYKIDNSKIKIAAGWLIDNANLKGYKIGGAMVHCKQALVIINNGNAKGQDFKKLSEYIQKKILDIYDINIYPEVIILK